LVGCARLCAELTRASWPTASVQIDFGGTLSDLTNNCYMCHWESVRRPFPDDDRRPRSKRDEGVDIAASAKSRYSLRRTGADMASPRERDTTDKEQVDCSGRDHQGGWKRRNRRTGDGKRSPTVAGRLCVATRNSASSTGRDAGTAAGGFALTDSHPGLEVTRPMRCW